MLQLGLLIFCRQWPNGNHIVWPTLQIEYYQSRRKLGQPVPMFPPGRVLFLRPMKVRRGLSLMRTWDAVYVAPEDLISEGILVAPTMLSDHQCSTAFEAIKSATAKAESEEQGRPGGAVEGVLEPWWGRRVLGAPWTAMQNTAGWFAPRPKVTVQPQRRAGSLQQQLINAV